MGRISKRIIDKGLREELEEQLSFIISSLTEKDEINLFLNEFLTKEEKIMLGKRLLLYMLLDRGLTNTQINSILGISYETTRWYKQTFENKPEIFKKHIKKLVNREERREFWEKIEKILKPIELALNAKTNMKARAKLASGDW